MPIYEYRCTKGHTFEVIQRMADDALDACEVCAAPAVRVLHAPAVHFKGSGFYNTDYGTKKRARERSAADSNGSKDKSSKSGDGGKSGDGRAASSKPASDSSSKPADKGAASSAA